MKRVLLSFFILSCVFGQLFADDMKKVVVYAALDEKTANEIAAAFQKETGYTAEIALQIEQAGTVETDAVRKVLASRLFETFYGPIKFGPNGQNEVNSPMILQIQKGKYVVLDPQNSKTGELAVGVRAQ